MSLGQMLRQKRLLLDLSLEEIEDKTSIKAEFIKALEDGDYHQLPPEVYVQGYLKVLSRLYGLELARLNSLYKDEYTDNLSVKINLSRLRVSDDGRKQLILTPRHLTTLVLSGLFAIILIYMGWQVVQVTAAPKLAVDNPADGQVIQERAIEIRGQTVPGSSLTINNQIIPVDDKGNFQQPMNLNLGENHIIIRAMNKFNRSTSITRRIVVSPLPEPSILGETSP